LCRRIEPDKRPVTRGQYESIDLPGAHHAAQSARRRVGHPRYSLEQLEPVPRYTTQIPERQRRLPERVENVLG